MDMLHGICLGVFPIILGSIMGIIMAKNDHMRDFGLLNTRLSELPVFPLASGFAATHFLSGKSLEKSL